jgi:hypothetical protein
MRKLPFSPASLGRQQKAWLYACFALLFTSGVLWLGVHYFGRSASPIGEIPHPSEAWWMRLHGLAAMVGLVMFGSMMPVHIRNGWKLGTSRASGRTMVGVVALLALSGYGLYYLVDEELRAWTGVIHWSIGLALLPAALIHVLYKRDTADDSSTRGASQLSRQRNRRSAGR